MDDVEHLVVRFRAGDQEAFTALVAALQPELHATIAARADSAEMVDEIMQRTLVTAFTRLDQYRGPDAFVPWVKSIARNHLRSEWRSRVHLARMQQDELAELLSTAEVDESDSAESGREEQRLANLSRCLAQLKPASRHLLELRYRDGKSLNDLAREVKRSVGSLAMILMRLREGLRRCIIDHEAGTGS